MKPKVKQFIESYIEAIEDNSLEFVFKQAAAELSSDEISELSEVLEEVNIPTEEVRWEVFDQGVVDYIQSNPIVSCCCIVDWSQVKAIATYKHC